MISTKAYLTFVPFNAEVSLYVMWESMQKLVISSYVTYRYALPLSTMSSLLPIRILLIDRLAFRSTSWFHRFMFSKVTLLLISNIKITPCAFL